MTPILNIAAALLAARWIYQDATQPSARERQPQPRRRAARERRGRADRDGLQKRETRGQGSAREPGRGRHADRPGDIPARGWRDVALRVKDELGRDNVSLIAAGLALYGLLAAFPALAAGISLYGLFASPGEIAQQFAAIADVLPDQAADILRDGMQNIADRQSGALGLGAVVGFFVALWSARKGMVALIEATNIAYDEREERSFVRRLLLSLGFTLAAVVGFLTVLLLAVAAPLAIQNLGLPERLQLVASLGRWVVLWILVALALAVIYRFGPDRDPPKWRWVTWGSAIATTLWILGSVLFSLYVRNFGSYGETYGALGGVVVLLLWFYLTGYIVILGAEINSEVEHQTVRDTTRGSTLPLGQRGAYVADTVGRSP